MKKFVLLVSMGILVSVSSYAMESSTSLSTTTALSASQQQRSVVFRTTQKLRSSDGREIYLYSSKKCELYDGDRCVAVTTYSLCDGEVRLLDERGNVVYKGSYRMKSDGVNLYSLTIAGTTYFAK